LWCGDGDVDAPSELGVLLAVALRVAVGVAVGEVVASSTDVPLVVSFE
jgi:hypothetical protein